MNDGGHADLSGKSVPAKKGQKESQQLSQVESGGAQGGVDGVAGLTLVMIAAHAVVGLQVADDGFDGRAAFQPFS